MRVWDIRQPTTAVAAFEPAASDQVRRRAHSIMFIWNDVPIEILIPMLATHTFRVAERGPRCITSCQANRKSGFHTRSCRPLQALDRVD